MRLAEALAERKALDARLSVRYAESSMIPGLKTMQITL